MKHEISLFLLNKDKEDILNKIKSTCEVLNLSISNFINDNDYTIDNFLNLYNDLIENKQLDNNKKLNNFVCELCLNDNKKDSNENKYNKLICENDKYKLTDGKFVFNCEISDIYDIENNLLFHNKKTSDLRVLSFQIINDALLLKTSNDKKLLDYIDKFNIDKENFKYVFGIIKNNKNITYPNKLAIGVACHMLKKLNIDYYIDFIEYIK